MIEYRVSQVGSILGLNPDTIRKNSAEANLDIEFKTTGSGTSRSFKPKDVFDLARWRFEKFGQPVVNKPVATVWLCKGGVGKTTMTGNFAVGLALKGLKVLVIDLDFQGSLTYSFGYNSDITEEEAISEGLSPDIAVKHTLYNLLPESDKLVPLSEVLKKPWGENGPHLIPSDVSLDNLDALFLYKTLTGKQSDLFIRNWIKEGRSGKNPDCDLSSYDVILFDCPPSKNRITQSAALASSNTICPVSLDGFSSKALSSMGHFFSYMVETFDYRPELTIVGNAYDTGRIRSSKHLATIANAYPKYLVNQTIRRSEEFQKALDGEPPVPLLIFKPNCPASDDIRYVVDQLVDSMKIFG